ncbi:MAG: TldD/PmbA family protein [Nanohaloarchaea archaeon]|nr:TldD/PmbA family protein [Candidatus Nanohaloarchaea archaeon]
MDVQIKRVLEAVMAKGANYADIRCSDNSSTNITQKNGKIEDMTTGKSFALGIRVLYKGSWGFASTNDMSEIDSVSDTAFRIAKSIQASNNNNDIVLADAKTVEKTIVNKYERDIKDVSIDDKVLFINDGYKAATGASSEIKSVHISYSDAHAKKVFANSEGAYITSNPQYFRYYVFSNARRGERIEQSHDRCASFSGIGELIQKDPAKIASSASQKALKLLEAELPPSGTMPAILHPEVGGVFVHEAVGHASEADHALRESIFTSKLGDTLGSEKLNIVDDATLNEKHGSYKYDDEGVRGKKTQIFKKGVLESYMHSRETAGAMGVESTGNGRAQSPEFMPIVRMSNTYFEKGDMGHDELFEGVKKGIYMAGFKGGQVDTTGGTFTFGVEYGYLIENGKKTKLVKDCAMSGQILDVLKNIDGVGNKLYVDSLGYCGKNGQMVPVCDGGPYLRVNNLLVGGQK